MKKLTVQDRLDLEDLIYDLSNSTVSTLEPDLHAYAWRQEEHLPSLESLKREEELTEEYKQLLELLQEEQRLEKIEVEEIESFWTQLRTLSVRVGFASQRKDMKSVDEAMEEWHNIADKFSSFLKTLTREDVETLSKEPFTLDNI